MRILLALLLSGFAAHGAVTGAVQADSTKHVTQPSGFWTAQPSDSTFVSAVRAAQSSTSITGAVASVQGKAGIVSLTTSDIPEGTNLFWTTVRSNNLTAALWQFAVAYFYALSNPSNFVIASAGRVTNNVNSDTVTARSIGATGNATFLNTGNAGAPLTVNEMNGTNFMAQFINTVNGRSVLMNSNADITIGAGKFSGDGSGLTNLSNQTITLSGDATGSGTTAITVVGVNAKNSTNFWGLLSGTNLPALTGDITSSAGSATTTLKSSPTIVTPTIASFSNATHTHQNAAGGGTLDGAAIASGSIADARLGNAVLNTRTITLAVGSASLTTSAGAQDLSANRTWTLDTAQNIQTSASPTFAGLTVNGSGNANIGGFIIATNGYQAPTNTVAANSALTMGLSYDIVTSGTLTLGISTFANVPSSTYSYVNLTITSSGTATFTNHPSIHMSDGLSSRVLSNSCEIAVKIIPRFRTNAAIVPFP